MHGSQRPAAEMRASDPALQFDPLSHSRTESPATESASAFEPKIRRLQLADRDATLRCATGSDDPRVHDWLVNDVAFALTAPPALGEAARQDRVCAAVTAMCDIAPRDTIEGMLAAQMVAVHAAALDCLRRAADPVTGDRARDTDLRHASRLLNVFHRQTRIRDDRRNPVLPPWPDRLERPRCAAQPDPAARHAATGIETAGRGRRSPVIGCRTTPRDAARLRAAPRCGARTRAGTSCASPAVRGRCRCRMHGGARGSGAPRGNRNA